MSSLKARIKITNYCKNGCWYCLSDERNNREISDEVIDKILLKLRDIYNTNKFKRIKIGLTGGDPFSSDNIINIFNKINATFKNNLTISDICLHADMNIVKEFINMGGYGLVSLNEDPVDEMTNRALQIRRDRLYLFNVLLTKYNINRIDEILDSAIKNKLPLRLNHLFDPDDKSDLIPLMEEAVDYIYPRLLRENFKFNIYSYPFGCIHMNKHKCDNYCGYGKDHLFFDTHGNIRRCQMEPHITNISSNNIMEDIKCETPNHIACEDCPVYDLCKGGCPHTNKNNLYCNLQYKICWYIKEFKEKYDIN